MDWLVNAWAHKEEIAAWIVMTLAATTALAHALQAGAHALDRFAATTPTKRDDALAKRLVVVADAIAGALDSIAQFLPRVTAGRGGK